MNLAQRLAELDHLRRQRDQTGNSLYVWEAIRLCHHPHYSLPYPDWVRDYLCEASEDLICLGHLLDPRTYPDRRSGESDAALLDRIRVWETRAIRPDEAAAIAAVVLGFVRRGWNAFRRFHADAAARGAALDFEFPPDGSRRSALAQIRKAGNLEEDGSARRRIAYGRRLLERPAPRRQPSKPTP